MSDTSSTDPPAESKSRDITKNVSGGVDVAADQVTVGGDVAGRDKTVSATTYIEHATIVPPTPVVSAPVDEAPAPGEPPFKGLPHFDEADADLFFGRERLTAKLVRRLREQRFLAVVGSSGSGNPSIVRAGLVSALKLAESMADGTLAPADSARWPMHIITPTSHPLEALAASLTRDSESVPATATQMDDLAPDPRSLLHLAGRKRLGRMPANQILLIVDQFEELFMLCRSDTERIAFVNNLLTAVEVEGPTIVVIALRADSYAHCAKYDNLREIM